MAASRQTDAKLREKGDEQLGIQISGDDFESTVHVLADVAYDEFHAANSVGLGVAAGRGDCGRVIIDRDYLSGIEALGSQSQNPRPRPGIEHAPACG